MDKLTITTQVIYECIDYATSRKDGSFDKEEAWKFLTTNIKDCNKCTIKQKGAIQEEMYQLYLSIRRLALAGEK